MWRDTYKTAGDIRSAAFQLSHPEHARHPVTAAELHDSICRALPSHPETPATVSRSAVDLLAACELLIAGRVWPAYRAARVAVAKARGAA